MAIVNASRQIEDYDIELGCDPSVIGIYTASEIEPHMDGPKAMVERVCEAVLPLAKTGKLVAVLGGEHTVALGSIQAFAHIYDDLSVLYFDAHADLRDEYMGTRWGHASVARRTFEVCPISLVGVRSLSEDEYGFVQDNGIPVFFWPRGSSIEELSRDVLSKLSDRVYVSIDLDVFDPSLMAAVGTPEPGGMDWYQVLELLKVVAMGKDIVGFDITELSPREGPEACAFTAAKLAYKLIGYATSLR